IPIYGDFRGSKVHLGVPYTREFFHILFKLRCTTGTGKTLDAIHFFILHLFHLWSTPYYDQTPIAQVVLHDHRLGNKKRASLLSGTLPSPCYEVNANDEKQLTKKS